MAKYRMTQFLETTKGRLTLVSFLIIVGFVTVAGVYFGSERITQFAIAKYLTSLVSQEAANSMVEPEPEPGATTQSEGGMPGSVVEEYIDPSPESLPASAFNEIEDFSAGDIEIEAEEDIVTVYQDEEGLPLLLLEDISEEDFVLEDIE